MLKEWRIDLHVHTCLSPCGDPRMVPTRIIRLAEQRGLDAVAITDHNTGENVESVRRAAAGKNIKVLGGMEITSAEEIHILSVFHDDKSLTAMQEIVHASLPGTNDPEAFGRQWIVDDEDGIVGESQKLLIGATTLPIERIVDEVHRFGGVVFAAHIDRMVFSVISQIGFIPAGVALDGVEVSPQHTGEFSDVVADGRAIVTFSDAHHPEDIGRAFTTLIAESVSIDEIRKASAAKDGRRLIA